MVQQATPDAGVRTIFRHHIGFQPTTCRALPSPLDSIPREDACTHLSTEHSYVAVGGFTDTRNVLVLVDLELNAAADGAIHQERCTLLESAQQPGTCTDMAVWRPELNASQLRVLTATTGGAVTRALVKLPTEAAGEEAQLAAEGVWCSAVNDAFTAVHAQPVAGGKVVACSEGGRLFVGDANAGLLYHNTAGGASFSHARWASEAIVVTAGSAGGIELWDVRQKGTHSVARSDLSWGHTGCRPLDERYGIDRQTTSLATHFSRPFLCATGSSQGVVSLWDIRFISMPLSFELGTPAADVGAVTAVQFDHVQSRAAGLTMQGEIAALFCTEGGCVGMLGTKGEAVEGREPKGLLPAQFLTSDFSPASSGVPLTCLDLDESGSNLYMGTEAEMLVHVRRL